MPKTTWDYVFLDGSLVLWDIDFKHETTAPSSGEMQNISARRTIFDELRLLNIQV